MEFECENGAFIEASHKRVWDEGGHASALLSRPLKHLTSECGMKGHDGLLKHLAQVCGMKGKCVPGRLRSRKRLVQMHEMKASSETSYARVRKIKEGEPQCQK